MKILYTHLYDASFGMGGAEKVLLDLAQAFKARGDEVAVAVNQSRLAEKLIEARIPVTRIYWSKPRTFHTLQALMKTVKEFKPDLIHSHHRYTTFLADLFLKARVPVLHTEHVLRYDKRLLFRTGSQVTAVHETVAENLKKFFHVPSEKIVTIPNAVRRPEPGSARMNAIRQKMPRVKDELWALFIGRLEEQKGHIYLIEAVSMLTPEERSRFRFVLAGDGSLEASLRKRVEELGLQDLFFFLGHTDEVPEWLVLCDLVVLPSLWEGMPLSVLEAFSAGKAVLATDIPGTREVMVPGETGWLAAVRDPGAFAEGLRMVLQCSAELPIYGNKAFKRWQQEYSFDVMVGRYRKVYESLIGMPK